MQLLILGMAIFIGIHLLPSFASARQDLIVRWGEKRYKALFALASALGLVLIIIGKARAGFVPLWTPPVWGRHAAQAMMPFSLILLAAAYLPSNIKRVTAHPMLWGVTIWAVAHLLANGDLAALILFGGFGAYSLFDMWSANRRGAHPGDKIYPLWRDALPVAAGVVAYGILLLLHPYLFGVSARG